jgi:Glycosyl transferase family 11
MESQVLIVDNFLALVMIGRLGNQIGTLAAGLSYAWENELTLICPQLGNHPIPQWVENIATPRGEDFAPNTIYWRGMCYNYLPVYERLMNQFPEINSPFPEGHLKRVRLHTQHAYKVYEVLPNDLLIGYFFNERFFVKYKDKILRIFQPSWSITNYLRQKYGAIMDDDKSVGIHYRDFVNDGDKWVPKLTDQHFKDAIDHFSDDHKSYVCSNNLASARNFFDKLFRQTGKRVNYIKGERDFIDFYLLSSMKNIIISNSSFGWWAGYLNIRVDKKVIAPVENKWFMPHLVEDPLGIIPESEKWIIM